MSVKYWPLPSTRTNTRGKKNLQMDVTKVSGICVGHMSAWTVYWPLPYIYILALAFHKKIILGGNFFYGWMSRKSVVYVSLLSIQTICPRRQYVPHIYHWLSWHPCVNKNFPRVLCSCGRQGPIFCPRRHYVPHIQTILQSTLYCQINLENQLFRHFTHSRMRSEKICENDACLNIDLYVHMNMNIHMSNECVYMWYIHIYICVCLCAYIS